MSSAWVDKSPTLSASSSSHPLPVPVTSSKNCMSAATKRYKYLRKLFHFRQMDFEFALWQMIYLLVNPKKVYRNFNYRKVTKSQFARGRSGLSRPLSGWLFLTSVGFSFFILGLTFSAFLKFLLYVIFVDCIGMGLIIATLLWYLTNKYCIKPGIKEDVEWGFAFDIHLNAFFPSLVILHGVQLFIYHWMINSPRFISTFFGNSLWLCALGYYVYITFLGYNSLPFLRNTKRFLYPMGILFLFYLITLAMNWNLSVSLMYFYSNRVL